MTSSAGLLGVPEIFHPGEPQQDPHELLHRPGASEEESKTQMENRKLFSSLLELDPKRRIYTEEARGRPFFQRQI
jgi:hypothetical protein